MQKAKLGQTYTINIGEELRLEDGLMGTLGIRYAGRLSEDVFSISYYKSDFVFQKDSANLYFPTNSKFIDVDDHKLAVFGLTSDSISLQYRKED